MFWQRWDQYFPDHSLFSYGADETDPHWADAQQGAVGDCYLIASMAAVAEYPAMVRDVFLNTPENEAGIY